MRTQFEFITGIKDQRLKQLRNDGIHSIAETIIDWPAVCHGIIPDDFVSERDAEHTEAGIVVFHQQLRDEAQQNQVSGRCS